MIPRAETRCTYTRVLCGVVLLAATGACAHEESVATARDWPPRVPEVEVSIVDFGFRLELPVPSGRVMFRVRNDGAVTHRASLVPLPEDLPPVDEQLRGDERRSVPSLGAINERAPGEGSVFAVDLEHGRRYALICFLRDEDGIPYYRRGMTAEFRAGGPDAEPPANGLDDS